MDISFHGKFPKETSKYTVYHLLNSSQINDIHYMPEDQIGLINTQPLGYKPHYEYIYKRTVYKLPYSVSDYF